MENQDTKKNEPIDLTKLLEGYEDRWVVISKDYKKVLKSANDIKGLNEFIDKGIIMLVPNPNYSFSPYSNNGI